MSVPDPLDAAARAGWLYYAGGLTQDQIAQRMGISRQRAQRLVSRAMQEGLVRVRLEHPLAVCLDLEARLRDRFELEEVRVAPSLGDNVVRALAPVGAALFDGLLARPETKVVALGIGRTLTAMASEVETLARPDQRLVSLIGNVADDGSASQFAVIMTLAGRIGAPHYPMPAPVFVGSAEERAALWNLQAVRAVRDLAQRADLRLVGLGQMGPKAPLLTEGFITATDLADLERRGAVGELTGHAFDAGGRYIDTPLNDRLTSLRIEAGAPGLTVVVGAGPAKITALRAALTGRLMNGLVTDEPTALALLDSQIK
ncbi:sugar-binding transcriptional regulator [Falsirhodobacter sp. 20TX0035]|uniref:sugar-binding transcriptional regulator n=1 Tax=Falsirhodobacter sp. 20TX0035 TaxID=3022019 RepID=UPI00232F463C|nr:sugar-binding transcriptional regulator [Falsirhodobacter sp. 20TX0035]MDB6453193.1 sugar-binding transcriptional regulator [Falsirhodobacter sp. 20TX0035]